MTPEQQLAAKEALRKEFEDRFTYEVTGGRWVCTGTGIPNKLFEWSYTKLTNQAKDLQENPTVKFSTVEDIIQKSAEQIQQLKSELSKANEKITQLYDANCIMGVELSDLRERSTEEKAKAFDEGTYAMEQHLGYANTESRPANPYDGKQDLQKSTE